MATHQPSFPLRLFYSYSHHDELHRSRMEKSLENLKIDGLLHQWSDHKIVPGQSISQEVRCNIERAHIVVFLMSTDFIASAECRQEWELARTLHDNGQPIFRIPIILRDCAWKDMLGAGDVKALPVDGRPVASFNDFDTA